MSLRIRRTAATSPSRAASLLFVLPSVVALGSLLASQGCVIRLNDRNEPLENGGVTGPDADCSTVTPPSKGGPGTGPAVTKFVGRYDLKDPTKPRLDWSGNYMTARFQGSSVSFGLESGIEQVLEMVIDNGPPEQVILGGLAPLTKDVLLPDGIHEITVMRSSEALFGDMAFVPFTFGSGTKQLPPTERPRRIEYIGDSITCGYGNEGANATCPYDITIRKVKVTKKVIENGVEVMKEVEEDVKIPETQNVYLAYGSLAARQLSAEATTLCFSGKGVVLNYREVGFGNGRQIIKDVTPDPDATTTIPEYYLRTVATERPGANGENLHDFTKDNPLPQVVVINIGTNDFARDVNQDTIADGIDLGAFRDGYKKFVEFVRSKRPDAHIFVALPPMLSDKFPLDNARSNFRSVLKDVAASSNAAGDPKVYFIELVEMGVRYGLGCDYHPNLTVHQIMADQVAGAIRKKTCWD